VAGVDVTFAEVRASDRYIVVVIDAVGSGRGDDEQRLGTPRP